MTANKEHSSRRKFIGWGMGALAAFSAIGLFFSKEKRRS
jgi:hypothetical protein